jgi:hypothetical protein
LVPSTLVDGLGEVPSVCVVDGLTDGVGECVVVVVVDGLTEGDGDVVVVDGLGDGECEWVWLGDGVGVVVGVCDGFGVWVVVGVLVGVVVGVCDGFGVCVVVGVLDGVGLGDQPGIAPWQPSDTATELPCWTPSAQYTFSSPEMPADFSDRSTVVEVPPHALSASGGLHWCFAG